MMKSKRFYILFALVLVLTAGLGLSSRYVSAEVLEDYYLEGNGNSLKWESAVNDYHRVFIPRIRYLLLRKNETDTGRV